MIPTFLSYELYDNIIGDECSVLFLLLCECALDETNESPITAPPILLHVAASYCPNLEPLIFGFKRQILL